MGGAFAVNDAVEMAAMGDCRLGWGGASFFFGMVKEGQMANTEGV